MIPRLLGFGSQSRPFGTFRALRIGVVLLFVHLRTPWHSLRIGVVLLFRTSLYAMASVSSKMVSHMRVMFIGLDFGVWVALGAIRDISGYYKQCSSDNTRLRIAPEFSVPLGWRGVSQVDTFVLRCVGVLVVFG